LNLVGTNPLTDEEKRRINMSVDGALSFAEERKSWSPGAAAASYGFAAGAAHAAHIADPGDPEWEAVREASWEKEKRALAYAPNPTTCAVCGKGFPESWPWLSWEGRRVCSSQCFGQMGRGGMSEGPYDPATGYEANPTGLSECVVCGGRRGPVVLDSGPDEVYCQLCLNESAGPNPTGIPFSGQKYYRPARREGLRVIRKRIRLARPMRRRSVGHTGDYIKYRPNPLLMTVVGNPQGKDDAEREIDPAAGLTAYDPYAPGGATRMHYERHPKYTAPIPAYGGTPQPDDPVNIASLRSIATGGMPAMYEGVLLDPASASILVQVYDGLGPDRRRQFSKMSLPMMSNLSHTLLRKRNPGGACLPICTMCNGYKENPRKRRKVTMTLKKFAAYLQRHGTPEMRMAFQQKIRGYKKWTHGTLPSKVTLEQVDVPGMDGLWITYDMGREPEKTYIMPGRSKRTGAWKHPWEKMPHLKGDPEAGLILTKTVKGNKITDFLHG
jgi:hypothetical protein